MRYLIGMTLRETLRKATAAATALALVFAVANLTTLDGGHKRARRENITYIA